MILENFTDGYDITKGSILAKSETNDCVVRAVANAFNISYDKAHEFAANKLGRKPRKGVQNTFNKLNNLGVNVKFKLFEDTLFPETKTFKLKCTSNPINTEYKHKKVKFTVKTFCSKFSKGTYIILVKDHALTIKNGVVIDNPDMRFTGFRRPVIASIKIS
tara:strand:- start:180 stop:662 length:483 start_codon:yes stop_codon:yes gene_type:complete